MIELIDRTAIEFFGCDELVARCHQRVHDDHLSRMAGGDRQASSATLERCDALFQYGASRVADASIDISKSLKAEQRSGVIDVIEYERGGLIDRRGASAGGRIGLGACMYGKRIKARSAVCIGHESPLLKCGRRRLKIFDRK